MRTFSRPDETHNSAVDLQAVCASAARVALHHIRHRTSVELDFDPSSIRVWANESRVAQVFINLLNNAAYAMPDGRPVEQNVVRIRGRVEGDRAIVEVSDNASGIAYAHLPRIFDPFFTTKPLGAGTGLGLPVCRGIITSLGGTLDVSSVEGEGSTFRISLPHHAAPAVVATKSATSNRVTGRVLLVDDEPLVRKALSRTMRSWGLEITEVADGQAALDALNGAHTFDVILCDLMMPRLTGMDLHALLASRSPNVARTMLFLTGGAVTERAKVFIRTLPERVFDKPLEPERLRAAIEQMLKKIS